ncbi:MAG TPA: hypothetical protein VN325_44005 [Steroidobacteraceae bacterium]|nr:hypothetical protein [Steroidobacteraceae bacterium]
MVRIEVRPAVNSIKDILSAGIDDRFPKTFRVSSLPIRAWISMRQIRDQESRLPNLDSHPVIDKTGWLFVVKSFKFESSFVDRGNKHVSEQAIQVILAKWHSHEGNSASSLPAPQFFKTLPPLDRELHRNKFERGDPVQRSGCNWLSIHKPKHLSLRCDETESIYIHRPDCSYCPGKVQYPRPSVSLIVPEPQNKVVQLLGNWKEFDRVSKYLEQKVVRYSWPVSRAARHF